MKLDILRDAMHAYRRQMDKNNPDYPEVVKAYRELTSAYLDWRESDRHMWKDEVHVVPVDTMICMQNFLLYDAFGKRSKELGKHVSLNEYRDIAREYGGLDCVSLKVLESGYDFLCDLWDDNENFNQNNPDGTCRSSIKHNYKVLHYDYINTGGNCMVGVFRVWLPKEKRIIWALANEEGCVLSTVDYISEDISDDIDDYDEFIIENVDWGRVTGHEKYFELYRHCLNEYTKSDCKHFGYVRGIAYHLLSDELKRQVKPKHLKFAHEELGDLIDTDGYKIIVPPDFD